MRRAHYCTLAEQLLSRQLPRDGAGSGREGGGGKLRRAIAPLSAAHPLADVNPPI